MNFELTQAQEVLRQTALEFAQNELKPRAEEIDRTGKYPNELFEMMAKIGFNGIGVPEKYGGSGGGSVDKAIVVMELAKKCASSAAILSIHTIFNQSLMKFGTEEQKQRYCAKMCEGGKQGAFALTEPNAGSDAAGVRTTAIYDESTGEYVLNGSKCFISGGGRSEAVIVFALTDPSKGVRGMSAIIVDKGTPGFEIGKKEDKMGLNGSETYELFFENCRVSKDNLLGKEGKGFSIAMTILDGARIGIAAQGVGIAMGAFEEAVKYSKERVQFGKPISALQGIQWYLADMGTQIEAAKWLMFYAASLSDSGKSFTKEAAMAKLNAATTAREVTNLALQVHGGYGYMKDYPLERMYRDAKITEIYEGTSEIHKVVISREILK